MTTTEAGPEDRHAALQAGANAYLVKPVPTRPARALCRRHGARERGMNDLLAQFVAEARDSGPEAGEDLLALERSPADRGRDQSAVSARSIP